MCVATRQPWACLTITTTSKFSFLYDSRIHIIPPRRSLAPATQQHTPQTSSARQLNLSSASSPGFPGIGSPGYKSSSEEEEEEEEEEEAFVAGSNAESSQSVPFEAASLKAEVLPDVAANKTAPGAREGFPSAKAVASRDLAVPLEAAQKRRPKRLADDADDWREGGGRQSDAEGEAMVTAAAPSSAVDSDDDNDNGEDVLAEEKRRLAARRGSAQPEAKQVENKRRRCALLLLTSPSFQANAASRSGLQADNDFVENDWDADAKASVFVSICCLQELW